MTKNALLKRGPKNSGMGRPPPPPFGQCPKENVFFPLTPYLKLKLSHAIWAGLSPPPKIQKNSMFFLLVRTSLRPIVGVCVCYAWPHQNPLQTSMKAIFFAWTDLKYDAEWQALVSDKVAMGSLPGGESPRAIEPRWSSTREEVMDNGTCQPWWRKRKQRWRTAPAWSKRWAGNQKWGVAHTPLTSCKLHNRRNRMKTVPNAPAVN